MRNALTALLCTLAACAPSGAEPEVAAGPHPATITATDYAFAAPDSVPAGLVSWTLESNGPTGHHVLIARVGEGHTSADAIDSLRAGIRPDWLVTVGGLEQPGPGIGDARFIMDMSAGEYVLFCLIGSTEGRTHAMEGMVRGVTVVASAEAVPQSVVATDTVRMIDFAFDAPDTISAGLVRLRLENSGAQRHHAVIEQTPDTITVPQLLADFAMDAPPPGYRSIGGFTSIAPGQQGWYEVTLTPGRYMLACLITDPATGRAHVELGMIRLIQVVAPAGE